MSKADQLAKWVRRAFDPPEADFVTGRCQECGGVVWIATLRRPHGMARSCEEHWPLSEFDTNHD